MGPEAAHRRAEMVRVAAALDLMSRYHAEGEDLFNRIVTGDEKWVHHFTPEMKVASKQWVTKGDERPVKAKRERSAGKVLLTTIKGCYWKNTPQKVAL